MVSPGTHLVVKNLESQSKTIESKFKQQWVLNWKFTRLYATTVDHSWTSPQRPPWEQKKVAFVERFKGAVSLQSSSFSLILHANYSPSTAMELKVSKEITCQWQSQRFETNKYVSWALFLKLQTAEINFEKLLGWTVFKNPNFNPFQSSSVLPNRGICCIFCLILTFL